jgi:hypothetical protein
MKNIENANWYSFFSSVIFLNFVFSFTNLYIKYMFIDTINIMGKATLKMSTIVSRIVTIEFVLVHDLLVTVLFVIGLKVSVDSTLNNKFGVLMMHNNIN